MTKVTGEWLHNPATQRVFSLLQDGDFQALVVGGCVRNALLGVAVADVDFTTDALPEQVQALAKQVGMKSIPTGIEHGTITLLIDKITFEVTTFRKDVQTDGRHAVIAYAQDMETDAHRRDFTINALYADQNGQVFDPLNGLADIAAKQLRFIDDAHARIREDYLRILRFFRFHAWYGDPANGIDADALAACAELADGLDSLSKERIGAEMRKLLAAPDPAPSVASMEQSGVLRHLLPGASATALTVLIHHEQAQNITPNWLRRLASLGGQDQVTALRLSRVEQRQLKLYQTKIADNETLAELAYRHGAAAAKDVILLRAAMIGTEIPADLDAITTQAAAQVFPIKAADITTGEVGPALGARLKHLETEWIASGFSKSKAELLA